MLDLDAAVQWVHDNIAAFGGDPDRISLFGQSAGSSAVDAYTFAHPHDTIIKGTSSGTFGGTKKSVNDISQGSLRSLERKTFLPRKAKSYLFRLSSMSLINTGTSLNETAWNVVASSVGCGKSQFIV